MDESYENEIFSDNLIFKFYNMPSGLVSTTKIKINFIQQTINESAVLCPGSYNVDYIFVLNKVVLSSLVEL